MYNQKMAACLKANGKVLREFKDEVYVPFGQEYSILLKNLNSVKALVTITIDGQDVAEGGLVVNPNSEFELERFIKAGNLKSGNRFKFIQRTAGIEKHRGIKVDDGLIRIEFKYERPPVQQFNNWPNRLGGYNDHWNSSPMYGNLRSLNAVSKGISGDSLIGSTSAINCSAAFADSSPQLMNMSVGTAQSLSAPEVGITAPGSVSDQKFVEAAWFATEAETHVMVLRLFGETETGKQIVQPVTVKHAPVCGMCGHRNKARAKFCSECGAGLELV